MSTKHFQWTWLYTVEPLNSIATSPTSCNVAWQSSSAMNRNNESCSCKTKQTQVNKHWQVHKCMFSRRQSINVFCTQLLPAGRALCMRPAGPNITLHFLRLLVYIYIYIYICASTLITCTIVTSRSQHCCHATLLSQLRQFRRLHCVVV